MLILSTDETSENALKQKIDSVDLVLGDIENEEAYKIFICFYGIDWKPGLEKEQISEESNEFKLAPLLSVIEKIPSNVQPIPPWTVVKRFLIQSLLKQNIYN